MALSIGEKQPEWTYEEFSNGRWALKRHGYVVKTAYSIEELQDWAIVVHGKVEVEDPGKAMGRAIGML
jgi:hypothetical protein